MVDLLEIDKLTKKFADSRDDLAREISDLEEVIKSVREQRLPGIKRAFAQMAARKEILHAAIAESAALFEKPKTQVMHGVRVGYAKGKGAIDIGDEQNTVKLIETRLPELADVLIKIEKTPIKKSINALLAENLRKIGVTVEECGEYIVIKPVDSEVDKVIKAMEKNLDKELQLGEAA